MGIWSERDNHGFETEAEYLASLKKDDRYRFTYWFEYIARNPGDHRTQMAQAEMVVDVVWDTAQLGYVITFNEVFSPAVGEVG